MTFPSEGYFLREIYVYKSRSVFDLSIPLDHSRQHLILTGKNGSGKTSLLKECYQYLQMIPSVISRHSADQLISRHAIWIKTAGKNLDTQTAALGPNGTVLPDVYLVFNNYEGIEQASNLGEFFASYIPASRKLEFSFPSGIGDFANFMQFHPADFANNFVQFLVNLKAERSFARDDGDGEAVHRIDEWFRSFEFWLSKILDVEEAYLEFDRRKIHFLIKSRKDPTYKSAFWELADGHASILIIVAELTIRIRRAGQSIFNVSGIVLIDEIENHLHIEKQKMILPFLTDLFPTLQFIVSTHSPFVISSLDNATVCDLERRTISRDLSGYGWDRLVEDYFGSDKFSEILKKKVYDLERLIRSEYYDANTEMQIAELRSELDSNPRARELKSKLSELDILYRTRND